MKNDFIKHTARLSAALVAVLSAALPAVDDGGVSALRQQIMARIAKVEKDPAARLAAIEEGRRHAVICAYCHGPDGNSTKPEIPNLADQDPTYLLDQLEKFASGRREDYTRVMQRLAKQFSDEEEVALVVYYSSVRLKPAWGDPELAKDGAALYQERCQKCHGSDGRKKHGYARIAGQQPRYVEKVLKSFRDKSVHRVSPVMSAMTRDLSDAQIAALAAYIANL